MHVLICGANTHLSYRRMNLATKASRWKMTFCHGCQHANYFLCTMETHAAHLYSVLVECTPLHNVGSQLVVAKRDQLPCECLPECISLA